MFFSCLYQLIMIKCRLIFSEVSSSKMTQDSHQTYNHCREWYLPACRRVKKESLKLLEALCVFGYRELYKNFLLILVEMHNKIRRKKTSVPKRIMDLFGVSTRHIVAHMMRRGKFEQTKFSQAYRMDYNSNNNNVCNVWVEAQKAFCLASHPRSKH